MSAERRPPTRLRLLPIRMVQFAFIELVCCIFPIAIFLGLVATSVIWGRVTMPVARYDALLIYVIVVQVAFVVLRLEIWRKLCIICAFHLIGLAFGVFKVHAGSWSYPDAGVARIAGVPMFSGFMYASVGSYIRQALRHSDLYVGGFRWLPVSLLAAAAYLNFSTHHLIANLCWLIAVAFLVALRGSTVHFTVDGDRCWMPTVQAFILIGAFLRLAENAATLLGAQSYPDQFGGWHLARVGKLRSWALLITSSFVLVAAVKAKEGVLYGGGAPRVIRDRLNPNEVTRQCSTQGRKTPTWRSKWS